MSRIPHNRPQITAADRAAVDKVLFSALIAQGRESASLESDFVDLNSGGGACAVSSGTAALMLALRGLGIGRGDFVAVPTYTCSALLNAIHMLGAEPEVIDVRLEDFTIDAAACCAGARMAKAVIAVHCFGASADIATLRTASMMVVEDCCQSLGNHRQHVSDCRIYSFYATKIITGGQGGLVWDNDGIVAESARDYREFDMRKSYEPRFNLQMTDFQAAMIRSQLSRLAEIRERRRQIHAIYRESLPKILTCQAGLSDETVLPYRFVVRAETKEQRDALMRMMDRNDISTIVPIERFELLHRYMGLDPDAFPNGERLADTTLSLPLFPDMSIEEIERVANTLTTFH